MKAELLFLFRRDLLQLKEELVAYQNEETIWQLSGDLNNSAGNLALHICGNLQHFIGHVLGGSNYRRKREEEFSLKNVEREKLLSEVDQCISILDKVIPDLDEGVFENTYPVKVFNEPYTIAQMLIHLHSHLNYHLGQINYHRRILDA